MLLLASASPRRHELLTAAAIPHQVRAANILEERFPGEPGVAFTERMAIEKAHAVALPAPDDIVLGADTMVLSGDHILGKPVDDADVSRMLKLLVGQTHKVVTGFCLRHSSGFLSEVCTTFVEFLPLTENEIADYTQSGEGRGKAGAYAIQGRASRFVRRIDGCYHNVVGLPVSAVYLRLRELNYL